MFKKDINELLSKHLNQEVIVEVPPNAEMGDYAFPCFNLAKVLKKSPQQIAEQLAKELKKPEFIEKIEAKGPYINFFLNKKKLTEKVLKNIFEKKENYGSSKEGAKKTIVVDYSSPNIAKPFGIGHLRSTIIGNSIYKLYNFLGYNIARLNYLGDWGTQFGIVIAAYLKWGDKNKLKTDATAHLVDLYVKYNEAEKQNPELHEEAKEWFKKLEANDKEALKLWAKFKHLSIDEFRKTYKLLNVEFDSYEGESLVKDKVEDIIKVLNKITELNEGALIVKLDGMTPCMLKKSDETTTYASRDLAEIKRRVEKYHPEKIVYVAGSEQNLHFQQIFSIAKKVGWKTDLTHVNFGLYLGEDNQKLSTRKGKKILMKEVLDEVISLARKTIEEKNPELKKKDKVAQMVGVGALIFGDLVNDRIRDVVFKIEKILDFEGDTGPYVQYTYARSKSILRKAKENTLKVNISIDFSLFKDPREISLITELSKFNNILRESLLHHKPHILAQYLLKLARSFNEFYHACPCLKEENKNLKQARLLLVQCSAQVISNGMNLLGIECPEEM